MTERSANPFERTAARDGGWFTHLASPVTVCSLPGLAATAVCRAITLVRASARRSFNLVFMVVLRLLN